MEQTFAIPISVSTVEPGQPIWSQEDVDVLIAEQLEKSREVFNKHKVYPGLFVILGTYDPYKKEPARVVTPLVGPPMATENQKNILAHMLRVIAKGTQAVAVANLMEVWMATETPGPDGKIPSKAFRVQPSQRPDRTEHLMFMFESYKFGNVRHIADIERSSDDSPILKEWRKQDFAQTEGRFANILPTMS